MSTKTIVASSRPQTHTGRQQPALRTQTESPRSNWLLRRVIEDLAHQGEHRLSEIEKAYQARLRAIRVAA